MSCVCCCDNVQKPEKQFRIDYSCEKPKKSYHGVVLCVCGGSSKTCCNKCCDAKTTLGKDQKTFLGENIINIGKGKKEEVI